MLPHPGLQSAILAHPGRWTLALWRRLGWLLASCRLLGWTLASRNFLSWFRLPWHAVGWILLFLDFLWCVLPLRRFLDWVLDSWRFMGCVTSLSCAMQSTNDGFLERSTLKIVMEAMGDFQGIAMGAPCLPPSNHNGWPTTGNRNMELIEDRRSRGHSRCLRGQNILHQKQGNILHTSKTSYSSSHN